MFRETCVDVPEEKELCEFYKALFDQGEVKFFEYKEAGK